MQAVQCRQLLNATGQFNNGAGAFFRFDAGVSLPAEDMPVYRRLNRAAAERVRFGPER